MWVAIMDTEHYEWIAWGGNRTEALAELESMWQLDTKLHTSLDELEELYGIKVLQLQDYGCLKL